MCIVCTVLVLDLIPKPSFAFSMHHACVQAAKLDCVHEERREET